MTGVGIIGGGRWARVIASVLPQVWAGPVTVCSPGHPAAWDDRPTGWRLASLSDVFADPAIGHVIIARRARDHAPTVLAALAAGKAVLVEKPFCLTRAEADAILAAGGDCQTGLVFLYAPNQARFRAAVLSAGRPERIEVDWADPAAEWRYGAAKRHDEALNVVQNMLPHVWSLVRPLLDGPLNLAAASTANGGQSVTLRLHGAADVVVRLHSNAAGRVRRLSVSGQGLDAVLDFAREPGDAVLNGAVLDVATGHSSPLAAELSAFLYGPRHPLGQVAKAVEALDLTLQAMPRIRAQQAAALRQGEGLAALREVALGGVAGDGIPSDRAAVARWLGMDEKAADFDAAWRAATGGDGRAHNPATGN
ncbi:Gfo/Idh/MocA family protein [Thermaurantiacus sp.]